MLAKLKKLKNKLKKWKFKENKFLKEHQNAMIRIMGMLVVLSCVLVFITSQDHSLRPSKAAEYAKTSVMILNLAQSGGGSGVIFKSTNSGSYILTNAHVCRVVEHGGIVKRADGSTFLVKEFKRSLSHDICMVHISANLGINVEVASEKPEMYSEAHISGHPSLLPHVVVHAYFSGTRIIEVAIGRRACTDEEIGKYGLDCLFGIVITKTYEAQLVTGPIMPGSSGSAVFNSKGQIAGLAFASNSRGLSFAWIVPQEYVWEFVTNEQKKLEWEIPVFSPETQE